MSQTKYNKAEFLLSAPSLADLPQDTGTEVAFIGRSNAGKSSALNTITNIKGLARTSKTPGRTQMINMFSLAEGCRLVDLPGYGYAKVPLAIKQRWQKTLCQYLERRECLRGMVLVMDIRHPLKESDRQLIEWSVASTVPVHILLTKADKLSRGSAINSLLAVRKALSHYADQVSVSQFSSHNKTGLDDIVSLLDSWFEFSDVQTDDATQVD